MALTNATLATATNAIWKTFSPALSTVTYKNVSSDGYNVTTGLTTPVSTDVTFEAFIVSPSYKERQAFQEVTVKFITRDSDLSLVPRVGDKVTVGSVEYLVLEYTDIPYEQIKTFLLKRL